MKKTFGFTLVELLVVIVLIGSLMCIVMPAVNGALQRGRALALAANGRSLYQMLVQRQTEQLYSLSAMPWPQNERPGEAGYYRTSTEYFIDMVTSGVMNVSWSFFAAPGMTPARTIEEFRTGKGNAWCIVADADSLPDTAPMFFTRNVPLTRLDSPALKHPTAQLKGKPFDNKVVVFTTRGGASYVLTKDDLNQKNFEDLFNVQSSVHSGKKLQHRILRPE